MHRRVARNRILAAAGAAALGAAAITMGSSPGQPRQQHERSPTDGPAEVRVRDLTPEQVRQLPGATVDQAVFGADLDHRAVVWQRGRRQVLAVTTDGGESWTYSGKVGQYFALSGPTDASGIIWVSADGGGAGREEAIIDPEGKIVAAGEPQGISQVDEDDVLVMHLPRRNAERQVAVGADGSTSYWPGDPWLGERRTGVVGAWEYAVQLPTGVIVQQVAGPQAKFGGVCCASRPVVRWSLDGGTTWVTRALDTFGASEEAIYPFTITIPSLSPDTIAVHESTEGGTRTGRPLIATQRFAVDGSSALRFVKQFSTAVDVAWSVVLPGGELLVWVDTQGPWISNGDDWSAMAPAAEYAAPPGVDAAGLALADVHLAGGESRVVAVARSGDMLVIENHNVEWTHITH